MDVLVTGGTGFVGSHTAAALKKKGHRVRLLVRSADKAERVLKNLGISVDEIIVGDVIDAESVKRAVAGCDAVIHSAAIVATAEKHAELVDKTNVGGTKLVIGAALEAGVKKIIHVSSVTALFTAGLPSMNEESPVGKANNPYGRSKVACENYIRDLQAKGAPIMVSYPAAVIGPFDPAFTEPHQGLQIFLKQVALITSTGIQFVDVRDVADGHVKMLEESTAPNRYVMGGYYYEWKILTDTLDKITGRKLLRLPIPKPILQFIGKICDRIIKLTGRELTLTSEAMSYATQWVYAENCKIEQELGFTYRNHEETLRDTLLWMVDAGHLTANQIGILARNVQASASPK
jgi:nucleoside-diphosphate-sugar epimerase